MVIEKNAYYLKDTEDKIIQDNVVFPSITTVSLVIIDRVLQRNVVVTMKRVYKVRFEQNSAVVKGLQYIMVLYGLYCMKSYSIPQNCVNETLRPNAIKILIYFSVFFYQDKMIAGVNFAVPFCFLCHVLKTGAIVSRNNKRTVNQFNFGNHQVGKAAHCETFQGISNDHSNQ